MGRMLKNNHILWKRSSLGRNKSRVKSNKDPYLLKSKERNTFESVQNILSIKLPSALTITME